MRRLLIFLALMILAPGCAGSGHRMKSYTAETFPVSSATILVQDVVGRIHSIYPPGQTTLFLTGSGDLALAILYGPGEQGSYAEGLKFVDVPRRELAAWGVPDLFWK